MIDPIQYKARKQAWESATKEASVAAKSFNDTQFAVLEAKVGFFEKLALFDTGTIAATITMAGSLHQHEALHWKWTLFSGWILLLVAMTLCLFRNWNTHSHRYYGSLANYEKKNAESIATGAAFQEVYPGPLVDEAGELQDKAQYIKDRITASAEVKLSAQKFESKSSRNFNYLRFSENAALVLTLAGVSLLLIFTIHSLL